MKIAAVLITFLVLSASEACVNYNPNNGTYTVDPQGCYKHKKEKSESEESGCSRDRTKDKKRDIARKRCKD